LQSGHSAAVSGRRDSFIVGRHEARHLAFGGGIHACIGASLARAELRAALLGLRARFPALRSADGDVAWMSNAAVRCPMRLDVRP
jgi:cytochrome P450